MVVPRPWCTKDPRPCVKAVGVVEILLSCAFGVILVTLPFIMLNQEHEIDYIKQFHHGVGGIKATGMSSDQLSFTLVIAGLFDYDCNLLTGSLRRFLDEYMKGKIDYELDLNSTEIVKNHDEQTAIDTTKIKCEIHIKTKRNPTKNVVEVKGNQHSVASVAAECLSQFTKETPEITREKMTVLSPSTNQISQQKIYPGSVGADPERKACINEIILDVKKSEVLEIENLMYRLLGTATGFSLVAGFLLTSSAFMISRFLLLLAFISEVISVALIASGIIVTNDQSLCLFQYGGISVYAEDSPEKMQTIITYTCAVYCASVKFYCLWFIMAYVEIAPSLKAEKALPEHSPYVAEVAMEVNQKNRELGAESADIDFHDDADDDMSDDYDDIDDDDHHSRKTGERLFNTSVTASAATTMSKSSKVDYEKSKIHLTGKMLATPPSYSRRESDEHSFASLFGDDHDGESISKQNSRRSRSRERKHGGPENTLVAHRKDKALFANTFFGSSR